MWPHQAAPLSSSSSSSPFTVDAQTLLTEAQKRLVSTFSNFVPRQLESPEHALLCAIMCSMEDDDHIDFRFDRSVSKELRTLKPKLAFNAQELTGFLVLCSQSSPAFWSAAIAQTTTLLLEDERILQVLQECEAALVCTLSEPAAQAAWKRPSVRLAVVSSFLFSGADLANVHRSIFGVFVQADERRCDSLFCRIAERPLHTMLKTRVAEALAVVVCPLHRVR